MTVLHLTEQRALVRRDGETLVVQFLREPDGTRRPKVVVPLQKIEQVVVHGDVTLTTPAIHALLESGVEIAYLAWNGRLQGRLAGELSKNGPLREAQHIAHADPAGRLNFARRFVGGKLANMRTMLLRAQRSSPNARLAQAAERIAVQLAGMNDVASIASLLGGEGSGSAAYFGVFGLLVKQNFTFPRRRRRPPTDPVNALLSFGYSQLSNAMSGAASVAGLDPYLGMLHSTVYGRPAAALDLMEEFRPLIVDSVVLSVSNNRVLDASSFEEDLGAYRLTTSARKSFLAQYEARMNTEVQHPVFGYRATYRRCLDLQARLLAKAITGDIPAYPPFIVR